MTVVASPALANDSLENHPLEAHFQQLSDRLIAQLDATEALSLELSGEQSQFLRFNNARVRQAGIVTDANLTLRLISDQRTAFASLPCTGDLGRDLPQALDELAYLRQELQQLPVDPYIVLPENKGSSREVYPGELLAPEQAVGEILPAVAGLDFTGIYAAGYQIRANSNSAGQRHWFATESFFLDYSLIAPSEKAVKATLAGRQWEPEQYHAQIQRSQAQLARLDAPVHRVSPGQYRTYLAPAATAELLTMLSWGAISEASLRQGGSALAKLREGEHLSRLFNVRENFSRGSTPRFNELGEVSAQELPLITAGRLINTLISSRTAKEYGLVSNGAGSWEGLRAVELLPGKLAAAEILKQLDTGLYLSNLHYLNWSDLVGGRVTGMTRYACFWVEDGELVAPIQDLRFDESLYRCWGNQLISLTDFQEFTPEIGTYDQRALGGILAPGMLVDGFTFTL
jgi:predicted Zn-dependent protease